MENNNGRGIFYGVIGVATLVVAIIGATFAYFSASVEAPNAITNVASTTVDLDFDTVATNFKTDLIPVETNDSKVLTFDHDKSASTDPITAFAEFPGFGGGPGKGSCTDLVGNDICSMYVFTVTNPSTTTKQTVTGSITVTVNSGSTAGNKFTNLKYALFKGDGSKAAASGGIPYYDVNAAVTVTPGADDDFTGEGNSVKTAAVGDLIWRDTFGDVNTTHKWTTTEQLLGTSSTDNSATYTMVIWLEENGNQDTEQGVSFAASITFASPEGGGVTGMITSSN